MPAERMPMRSRNAGRNHPGTPSEIKSDCWARSSRIRERLPPESALRNQKFADSPLEGEGLEPSVPDRMDTVNRRRRARSSRSKRSMRSSRWSEALQLRLARSSAWPERHGFPSRTKFDRGWPGPGGPSQHAELEPRLLGHSLRTPRWRPDELDPNIIDAGNGPDRRFDLARHARGDRASGCRQCHFDINCTAPLDDQLVDQTELDEIHRDFRIPDGLQRGEHRGHQRQVVLASFRSLDLVIGGGCVRRKIERIAIHLPTPSLP